MRKAFPASLMALLVVALPRATPQAAVVEFNRDVRPILSDTCFQCHGPDKAKRKAKLHFDTEEGARAAIVAGKPGESELIRRISAADPEKRMPPVATGHALSSQQINVLTQWVAEGAKWQKHWSFMPPVRAALPTVKHTAWPRNPIDRFVLARLEKERLAPSPEADRITLLRRVSLDLTGLPPAPAAVDAFLADTAPDAYEKVVDRLLRSPRYGEHFARHWLDAARYADTSGYQNDGERTMWRWRDWVIDAFNANMPFDRFTIEQIAGDMLPGATMSQRIATGFNRNHRGNSEGGIIPEEYAVEYVVDRVDTTATVWLGLSAGCAKCHSHKYDPISQKEFYQLFAYFNNVPEKGKALKYGNSPPYLKTPTREQEVQLRLLQSQRKATEERFRSMQPALEAAQAEWEKALPAEPPIRWSLNRKKVAPFVLHEQAIRYARGIAWTAAPDPVDWAVVLAGQAYLEAGDVGHFGFFDKFTIAAWVRPEKAGGSIVSRMADTERGDGYNLAVENGKVHVQLVKRWLDDAIRVETAETLAPGQWHHVCFSYDGSRLASGIQICIDGRPARLKVNLDDLNQNFVTDQPLRIGAGGGLSGRFHGAIADVRLYDGVLTTADVGILANLDTINGIVAIEPARRTAAQRHKLRSYFLDNEAPDEIWEANEYRVAARKELEEYDAALPTTMVMVEMPTPRDTHLLIRGEYDRKGARVGPGVPAALPALAAGLPNNRLGFACWLVSPDNPLTPRVTVNRFWQQLFGAGLVRSVEDFGAQGEWPSHPELLDWLAVEFRDGGWDVKQLLKTIVTSATYRQSSKLTAGLKQKDPENRLLARGPRIRLSAEVIRDQALFASGLLVERIGGPSVRPYQPAGLGKELNGSDEDVQDHGASLYRRSLYTHWKRTVAPPGMTTFDAANRETCVVRQTRTNTPLQSLTLLNDVTFVEAARVLAQRLLKEKATPAGRLTLAFRLLTCRPPRPSELKLLLAGLEQHMANYRVRPDQALALVSSGEFPRDESLDPTELAAYTAITNLLLNLDEAITKE
jgi:mono/diheme cytochrome c family protein